MPKTIRLGGRDYALGFIFAKGAAGSELAAIFKDATPARGELRIEGELIEHLVLSGPRQVDLQKPGKIVQVPEGTYRVKRVDLVTSWGVRFTAERFYGSTGQFPPVKIVLGKQAVLKIGAPLINGLWPERSGDSIKLTHVLTGAGGEIYERDLFGSRGRRNDPPAFKVYQGDKLLASGIFEYDLGGAHSYSWRVPPNVYGKLKFVISYDLEALGPREGKPVIIRWSRWWNETRMALRLLPWVLLLGMLLLRANRNLRAWMILLPLGLVQGVAWLFSLISLFPESPFWIFFVMIRFMLILFPAGLAALLLISPYLKIPNRWVSFLYGLIVMGLAGAVKYVGPQGTALIPVIKHFSYYYYGIGSLLLILALMVSAYKCRKGFSSGLLLIRLAFWFLLGVCVAHLAEGVWLLNTVGHDAPRQSPSSPWEFLFGSLTIGLFFGIILFLTVLPVMILALRSGLYRTRLMALLYPATKGLPPGENVQDYSIIQSSLKKEDAKLCADDAGQ